MAAAYPILLLVALSGAPGEIPRCAVADCSAEPAVPAVPAVPAILREQYVPREGDMIFFTYYKKLWYYLFKMGNTEGFTYHIALVVKTPEGPLKLLEAGSLTPTYVQLVDVLPRVFVYKGRVAVRSLRQAPTPQQSQQLTCFAQEQLGKHFARKRSALDGAFNRRLSRLRYKIWGPGAINRSNWFCSELVTSALVAGGLLPDALPIPNAPFPCDLYYSSPRSIDPWYCPPVQLICAH